MQYLEAQQKKKESDEYISYLKHKMDVVNHFKEKREKEKEGKGKEKGKKKKFVTSADTRSSAELTPRTLAFFRQGYKFR